MATTKTYGAFTRKEATSLNPQIIILATQAADQASLLAVMGQAYTAMEKLITHEQDTLERVSTRSALGSLMRALNGEMEMQVERLVSLTSMLALVSPIKWIECEKEGGSALDEPGICRFVHRTAVADWSESLAPGGPVVPSVYTGRSAADRRLSWVQRVSGRVDIGVLDGRRDRLEGVGCFRLVVAGACSLGLIGGQDYQKCTGHSVRY